MDMASSSATERSPVNVLTYLRSKTQVDLDCLDVEFAKTFGPFSDCTSNQWEAYTQLFTPENATLLKQSVALSRQISSDFPSVTVEELAFEIAMVKQGLRMIPHINGAIHIMANPTYSYDIVKVVENGQRIARLCQIIEPGFDSSRLVIKVPATWEGMQACKKLKLSNVKTLATTLFTMEQAVLAGEVGCVSVSPFAYALRAHVDPSHHDPDGPTFDLIVRIQKYYAQHAIPTKVKACAFFTPEQALKMAGVDALTLPPDMLEEMAGREESADKLDGRSRFLGSNDKRNGSGEGVHNGTNGYSEEGMTFVNDRAKFFECFEKNKRGKAKTDDSIAVFCDFQRLAEAVVRDAFSANGDL